MWERSWRSWLALYSLLAVNLLVTKIDGLLCYCNEEECLSEERSNMCIQKNPSLGCYKQYYSKMKPAIVMGCVKYELLCDSSRIRPGPFKSEWPSAACCFTNHCNKNLPLPTQPLPIQNQTGLREYTTNAHVQASSQSQQQSQKQLRQPPTTTSDSNSDRHGTTSVTASDSVVHPVFLLLIVLVVIFLIIVMASILVIIKIWFYRRKKSKPQKPWIIQQNMLHTKAQMSHLLTDEPYESAVTCQELSRSNKVSAFDVP